MEQARGFALPQAGVTRPCCPLSFICDPWLVVVLKENSLNEEGRIEKPHSFSGGPVSVSWL